MTELETIKKSDKPLTRDSLATDLKNLGVQPGMTLLVHSSLSKLGWVSGGQVAVIYALMDALTAEGTLVMPTHSGGLSDPEPWENPPVPASWYQTIRDTMPAYDPQRTPSRGMGKIPELFRTWPDVVRSGHPQMSFAAWGKHAEFVTEGHVLDNGLGETSPLARIYDLDGYVLLLGVGYDSNTSFHLAEYRAPMSKPDTPGTSMMVDSRRQWVTFSDIEIDEDTFPAIGKEFDETRQVVIGKIGAAESRLHRQREGVDFAETWITNYRANNANG